MWQYIKNIIPRIQQFSGKLDHVETFVDKPWVLIDEDQNTHEYIFLRDHRLILSVNGKAIQGSWELLPTGKLLINRVTDQVLLEHAYIDEGILLLKISGGKDLPFILINEKVITDRDPVKYLEKVEAQKLNYELYITEDGITLNNSNSSTGKFEIGATMTYENGNEVNGKIMSVFDPEQYALLQDGVIQNLYYLKKYDSIFNTVITVRQKDKTIIQTGDIILNYQELPSHSQKNILKGSYYSQIIADKNGAITKVGIREDEQAIVIAIIVIVLFFLVIILATVSKQ